MKKYTLKNRKVNKRKTRHSNKKSLKEASNIKKESKKKLTTA